ncbi:MAG TPA: AmmeMemoRadiSam system radical SAM enzyme [Bacillota bacterium]|nr:AmmeMemoRadiSam system radical SAM enzyme [Bacillota bacterium]HOL09012.1 AmmeMemoRadiSam system radical SAM enzyme [Bacillota bacterium]HPO96687.1 AmmeMemoRadiSam system radical SAM enzyme [Bacillota bacterium]
MTEAKYYEPGDNLLICKLCPHECRIGEGQTGFCRVRRNEAGKLVSSNYGLVTALALDPIEKKPLYHFYPGKKILSVGTSGCNLACRFCQNWSISQTVASAKPITAQELLAIAVQTREEEDNLGLAYTYSEPLVWFEFLLDIMPLVKTAGLKNVLVTNAHLQVAPWQTLLEWVDAANIDLKGFDHGFYRRLCRGQLDPVLKNIELAAEQIHLELTTLIIPGENDHPQQLEALAKWVAAVNPAIPLHLSRYFPNYQLAKPPTPEQTMLEAYEICKQHLQYVYLGNLEVTNNTCCPECGTVLIERNRFRVQSFISADRLCPGCNRKITFLWQD